MYILCGSKGTRKEERVLRSFGMVEEKQVNTGKLQRNSDSVQKIRKIVIFEDKTSYLVLHIPISFFLPTLQRFHLFPRHHPFYSPPNPVANPPNSLNPF